MLRQGRQDAGEPIEDPRHHEIARLGLLGRHPMLDPRQRLPLRVLDDHLRRRHLQPGRTVLLARVGRRILHNRLEYPQAPDPPQRRPRVRAEPPLTVQLECFT